MVGRWVFERVLMADTANTGNPFSSIGQDIINFVDPAAGIASAATGQFQNFFSNVGGGIASGLEAGIDQIFLDLWNEIIGPLEIIAGSIVILIALSFLMSDNLASFAPLIASMV